MTTIVGVTLSFIYAPRTWCSFCPMGTISNWVAPKKAPLPAAFTNIHVSSAVMTTIVGVTLSFIYAPRTWCSFCPMGTISNWVAPKKAPLPAAFTNIHVSSACQMKCKQCARVCPMQLTPYDSRGEAVGYLHPDCLKCGKCVLACPTKIMTLKH